MASLVLLSRLSAAAEFDERDKGKDIESLGLHGADIDGHGHGDGNSTVVVGSDGTTQTITSIPVYEKTTISVVITQTMLFTDDIKTTDSNGNIVKTQTTRTHEITKTHESVTTTGTSYIDSTYTKNDGSVYVGDETVSVGGAYGTVIVGPGSVIISGSGKATTTSKTAQRTGSNGGIGSSGNSADQNSAGARTFLNVWGVGVVVMVFAGVGGLMFVI